MGGCMCWFVNIREIRLGECALCRHAGTLPCWRAVVSMGDRLAGFNRESDNAHKNEADSGISPPMIQQGHFSRSCAI